jgi:LuxR family transcriptional regulator of csgAB operon
LGGSADLSVNHIAFVVTTRKFDGELLAMLVRRECGMPCAVVSPLNEKEWGPSPREFRGERKVFFFDGYLRDAEEIVSDLKRFDAHLQGEDARFLYDLDPDTEIEHAALTLGVRGFFYVREEPSSVPKAVEMVLSGQVWMPRQKMARYLIDYHIGTPNQNASTNLTDREREILVLVGRGLGNNEIANQLNISLHTVKTHVYRIFRKIKVSNRWEASAWVSRHL